MAGFKPTSRTKDPEKQRAGLLGAMKRREQKELKDLSRASSLSADQQDPSTPFSGQNQYRFSPGTEHLTLEEIQAQQEQDRAHLVQQGPIISRLEVEENSTTRNDTGLTAKLVSKATPVTSAPKDLIPTARISEKSPIRLVQPIEKDNRGKRMSSTDPLLGEAHIGGTITSMSEKTSSHLADPTSVSTDTRAGTRTPNDSMADPKLGVDTAMSQPLNPPRTEDGGEGKEVEKDAHPLARYYRERLAKQNVVQIPAQPGEHPVPPGVFRIRDQDCYIDVDGQGTPIGKSVKYPIIPKGLTSVHTQGPEAEQASNATDATQTQSQGKETGSKSASAVITALAPQPAGQSSTTITPNISVPFTAVTATAIPVRESEAVMTGNATEPEISKDTPTSSNVTVPLPSQRTKPARVHSMGSIQSLIRPTLESPEKSTMADNDTIVPAQGSDASMAKKEIVAQPLDLESSEALLDGARKRKVDMVDRGALGRAESVTTTRGSTKKQKVGQETEIIIPAMELLVGPGKDDIEKRVYITPNTKFRVSYEPNIEEEGNRFSAFNLMANQAREILDDEVFCSPFSKEDLQLLDLQAARHLFPTLVNQEGELRERAEKTSANPPKRDTAANKAKALEEKAKLFDNMAQAAIGQRDRYREEANRIQAKGKNTKSQDSLLEHQPSLLDLLDIKAPTISATEYQKLSANLTTHVTMIAERFRRELTGMLSYIRRHSRIIRQKEENLCKLISYAESAIKVDDPSSTFFPSYITHLAMGTHLCECVMCKDRYARDEIKEEEGEELAWVLPDECQKSYTPFEIMDINSMYGKKTISMETVMKRMNLHHTETEKSLKQWEQEETARATAEAKTGKTIKDGQDPLLLAANDPETKAAREESVTQLKAACYATIQGFCDESNNAWIEWAETAENIRNGLTPAEIAVKEAQQANATPEMFSMRVEEGIQARVQRLMALANEAGGGSEEMRRLMALLADGAGGSASQ
ncbi:hypothetical protein MMC19_007426 [Ptychographa xylographoides]|nr:hypothetical protein [Ptychographa xylographoides]